MNRLKNIYKYSLIVLMGIIVFSTFKATAQSQEGKIIKGVVTDKGNNETLPGASVIVKNENGRFINSVVTDLDGRYTIKVNIADATLQYSYIGYKSQEVPINSQQIINIQLSPDVKQIDEVVVTSTGTDKSSNGLIDVDRRNLASSVTSVDISKISASSATSVAEMIQGRAAGVQITKNSGDPGAGVSIKIRGTNSLNASNDPLVVVDGIEFPIQGNISSVADLTNRANSPLSDINPENIDKIEILKDAGALAIYGSKGANGVIIITTKRGKKNSTIINFSSDFSTTQTPRNVPLLSGPDLKTFILEGNQNAGQVVTNSSIPLPELRDDQTRADYYTYNNNTDWVKAIQQTGHDQTYNLSLRGGGNTTAYSFSLGNTNQTGTLVKTGYNRLTANVGLDYEISKKLHFRTDVGYTRTKTDRGGAIGNGWQYNNSVGAIIRYPLDMARSYLSFLPVHQRDINGKDLSAYYIPNPNDNTLYPTNLYNPVAWVNEVSSIGTENKFWNNLSVIYDITSGLRFTSKLAVNFTNNNDDAFIPQNATNRNFDDAMINRSFKDNTYNQYIQQQNLLSYKKVINEKHSITLTGITEITWSKWSNFYEESSNSGSSLLPNMDATNVWPILTSDGGHDVGNSLRGDLHYVYNDKYGLSGTLTYQGSSKFGPSQRYATFPTVAVFWRISKESFLSSMTFISDIKFRYSVGKTGNQPNDQYLYYNTLSAGVPYINWTGVTPDNIQSSNLKWETSTENNLAMDMALFNNRFNITVEVYNKLTKDLLIKRSLPATSGFATYWTNMGNVRNKGIEFSLTDLRIIESKDITWSVSGNISANRNKLVYLPVDNGIPPVPKDGYNFMVTEGDPIGAFYGLQYKGVFATDDDAVAKDAKGNVIVDLDGQPKKLRYENLNGYIFKGGDANYEDLNHDGVINDLDRKQIGNANPLFDYAFGTRLTYKAFALDVFFQGRYGNDVINVARKNLENMQGGYQNYTNQSQSVLRRWRKQGDVTDMTRVTFDPQSHNNEGSNFYIEDASFLRLKSVALTYSLPQNLLKKVYIRNATITVNFYNWITWTKYTGQDPEISLKGDKNNSWIMGEDSNQTPVAKSVTVGLRLTF